MSSFAPVQPPHSPSIGLDIAIIYSLFRSFFALSEHNFGGKIGGKLLLYGPLDTDGASVALAANIAGAATLGIDSDAERLKEGIRHGYCDFLVNNLDEALRILKNEVRKKQPVSVCLGAGFAATLREIVERGVQPDVLAFASDSAEADILTARGAISLTSATSSLGVAEESSWIEVTWAAESAAARWLPKVDALAATLLPAEDLRRRWLTFAPRYLGRAMTGLRYLKMTSSEAERLSSFVAAEVKSGAIGTQITVTSRPG